MEAASGKHRFQAGRHQRHHLDDAVLTRLPQAYVQQRRNDLRSERRFLVRKTLDFRELLGVDLQGSESHGPTLHLGQERLRQEVPHFALGPRQQFAPGDERRHQAGDNRQIAQMGRTYRKRAKRTRQHPQQLRGLIVLRIFVTTDVRRALQPTCSARPSPRDARGG